jgi:hypothetical protein
LSVAPGAAQSVEQTMVSDDKKRFKRSRNSINKVDLVKVS